MMGERQAAGVCSAVIEGARRARSSAIEFRDENERGTAYLLMWVLGLSACIGRPTRAPVAFVVDATRIHVLQS